MIDDVKTIRSLLSGLPQAAGATAEAARRRNDLLTKPPGALGRLETIAIWLSAWQGRHPPRLERVKALVFAGNHGVVTRGVSAFPSAVTAQMVANFEAGGAAINQLCSAFDIALTVEAFDLDTPTRDFTETDAMSESDMLDAFNRGFEAVDSGTDLLCVGEMGIGNTTAAAAIGCALFGGDAASWTGPGTGLDSGGIARKADVVETAIRRLGDRKKDPVAVLAALGGREIAAMAGAILGVRRAKVPVLIDGYVCTAAASVLAALNGHALDHCLAAHLSAEPAHRRMLDRLGLEPLLDLGMRLGEASGAALAVAIVRGAVAAHTGMATFDEAGVSDKDSEE